MKKRLRKKLGKGEFTMIGFGMVFGIKGDDDLDAQARKFFDTIREDCLKPNNMGGGLFTFTNRTHGLLVCGGTTNQVSPEQRQTVIDWMNAREDVEQLQTSELLNLNDLLDSFPSLNT